jgi:hypothetical protein
MGGTPAFAQSVSDARQNSSTRSGTVSAAAMVSVVGALAMVDETGIQSVAILQKHALSTQFFGVRWSNHPQYLVALGVDALAGGHPEHAGLRWQHKLADLDHWLAAIEEKLV